MTADPSKYPQGYFKEKECRHCSTIFKPIAPSHLYCSESCTATAMSDRYYKKTYGLTTLEVNKMVENQNGVCLICEEVGFKMHENIYNTLNVDHDHLTGNVRGLLCHNCNRGLGLFKDNIRSLERAINYLKGATTISKESTPKQVEAHDTQEGDDIVCSHK